MVDIVNAYASQGFICTLITGLLVTRSQPLHPQVSIRKILTYNRNNSFNRLITWGFGSLQILILTFTKYRKSHLFIVSNPPFAPLLPLLLNNSFDLLIFDIYPDALIELQYLKDSSAIIKIWKKANKLIFKKADRIFTLTNGMKNVLKQYTFEKKITVAPLWSDNEFLKPISSSNNPFIKQYGLADKFIVLYSGNIGIAGGVDIILDMAQRIHNKNIIFVIIGSGARKAELENRVSKEKILNCLLLPWQDVSQLPYTLSAANLAVVTLGKGASRLAIPSKLFSLLSVGAPILGITQKESDLRQLIEDHEIGSCFGPDQISETVAFINNLANNPEYCRKLSNNAILASRSYTKNNAKIFLELPDN